MDNYLPHCTAGSVTADHSSQTLDSNGNYEKTRKDEMHIKGYVYVGFNVPLDT